VILVPGEGLHWVRFEQRWLSVAVGRESQNSGQGNMVFPPPRTLTIRTFGNRRPLLERLFRAAEQQWNARTSHRIRVFVSHYDMWQLLGEQHRPAESVVYPAGVFEELSQDARRFFENEEWYRTRGIPYRRGYLLHGAPGNGKTTMALALASLLQRDLYILAIGSPDMQDHRFMSLLRLVPNDALICIEDIDTIFERRERKADNKLSMSGLLNAIDGLAATERRLLILTTNYPDRLDQALIRPGRVDRQVAINNPDAEQIRRLFLRFFPGAEPEADRFARTVPPGQVSVAALQGYLLNHTHPGHAVAAWPTTPKVPDATTLLIPGSRRSRRKAVG